MAYAKPPRLALSSFWTQMYPPKPAFTEKDIPDLKDRVYIVTGSNTGVGKEVAQILYSKNAKVFVCHYIAARSESKAQTAITTIQQLHPTSSGSLHTLQVDFNDLSTLKPAITHFLSRETRLDVLFNNAAVQDLNPKAAPTAQNYEKHFGVNVLGPFLFTKLLIPILRATPNCRVVWVCSLGTEVTGERSLGITKNYLSYYPSLSPLERYGVSKAGSWLHAVHMAHLYPDILSIPCNPGHLKSDLYRDANKFLKGILNSVVLYPKVYGAYTELFAGLSAQVDSGKNGGWIVPWGRFHPIRNDLLDACREGGNGHARDFWEWCEEQVREFS